MYENIMERVKNVIIVLKSAWITVWLIIAASLLCVTYTFAAYTGVTQSKRVISLSERDDMLFSSRYLFVSESEVQKIGFSEGTADPTITIDVCNYDKSGLGKYGSDIYFQLSARLINYDGSEIAASPAVSSDKYWISYLVDDQESTTFKLPSLSSGNAQIIPGPETYQGTSNVYKLTGGSKQKIKFVLHFDPDALSAPVYAVELTANPVPLGGYDDIKVISGKVGAVSRKGQNLEWSGEFTDKMINTDPSIFDAYNYVISGVGTGTITLTYDNSLLELDKNDDEVFSGLTGYSKDDTTISGKTVITFKVDSTGENAVSRYAIHFYQKNGTSIPEYSDNYVKTAFTAD